LHAVDRAVAAILIRFDDHDEVGVCFGCVALTAAASLTVE
jgi:hypothetical protein